MSSEEPIRSPRVLVVDDDPDMRSYLRHCLRPMTDRVETATDGREALDLVPTLERLDLVIADVRMPGLDGPGLAERLPARRDGSSIPVLFVTGEDEIGFGGTVLRKPFNGRKLRAWSRALLERADRTRNGDER